MIKSIYIIFIFTVFIVKSAYNQQANFNEIDLKTNIGIDSIRINLLKFIFEFEQETQWSDFETKIDFKTKKRIILKLGREDFYNSQLNGEDKFEYANHFHFLDIDKDNDLDIIYNASEFFYNINVPTNIFSRGYIDIELECPSATANIDFITNKPLSTFFINLIIVDEDPILTKDLTLAPPIDYNNYNIICLYDKIIKNLV